jgi:hypothetical protein
MTLLLSINSDKVFADDTASSSNYIFKLYHF